MVTSYILVLTFSAWLMAFGISYAARRLMKLLAIAMNLQGVIALLVAVAFLVVAAAPSWAMLVALALLAVPPLRLIQHLPPTLAWAWVPLALLPLIATPLLGAPSWIALDSALIASSLLGVAHARSTVTAPLGRAFLPYLWLILWLAFEALSHLARGGLHA